MEMHVKDLLPTLLDLAGIEKPTNSYQGRTIVPMSGLSLRAALDAQGPAPAVRGPGSVSALEYLAQGYVMKDDWKLSRVLEVGTSPTDWTQVPWRLFNLETDRGETVDLSASQPGIVSELKKEWTRYVQENDVLIPSKPPAPKRDASAL